MDPLVCNSPNTTMAAASSSSLRSSPLFTAPPSELNNHHRVNPVINQQMCNGGLFPNNNMMPIVAPSGFMNFPNQPFPLQNNTAQFPPNGIMGGFNPQQNFSPFPVNQFNASQQQQQQQGQFFAHNAMNPTAYNQNVGVPNEQVILQNTIQNICQLLQLQNANNAQCPPPPAGNFPMFQNQIPNVMNHQNPGFLANQQFVMSNPNGPVQHANNNQGQQKMSQKLQGNPFLPGASGSVQPQNLLANLTNFQIPQGVGPQNHNFLTNQMFGMANSNGPMQHFNQGQPRFVPPMIDVIASRQIVNTGQTQNPTNFENNHGNGPANVNGGWAESRHKKFTGHKPNDASHKGFKSHKHVKEKFGNYNGNMSKDGNNNPAVDSGARNSINFEKKVPSLKYTEQEIKQWREARKKHYPKSVTVDKEEGKKEQTLSDVTNQAAMLRRQQLKEILAKQAKLGLEVADIPSSYLSSPAPAPASNKQDPREKKHQRERYKKGKFHKKRGTPFQDDRIAKKTRSRDSSNRTNNPKPNEREPSLLKKLLTRDIKRDQNHLLQVFRFIAVNSFFNGEPDMSLRFPSVIVRETNPDVPEGTTCSVLKSSEMEKEEEEGEITD